MYPSLAEQDERAHVNRYAVSAIPSPDLELLASGPSTEAERTPFVGPRPIQKGELLFGRDNEVGDLVDLLFSERVALLHSPSGAGKSSLVNAGLIPALEDEYLHVLPVIRVNKETPAGAAGQEELAHVNRYVLSTVLSLWPALPDSMQSTPSSLAGMSLDRCLALHEEGLDPREAVVLILDQFEEILTLDPIDLDGKHEFFRQLGEALRNPRRWALFAAREDYVGGLDPYVQPIPTQLSVRLRLDLLTLEAARQAIQRPRPAETDEDLHLLTDNFTAQAAARLAEDLAQIRVQQPDGTRRLEAGLHVEPVQLQVVCERLWRQAQERGESQVGVDALKEVGTVDEALAGYFAEKVEAIADPPDVPEWRIRHWFDHQLITAQGIRGQVMRGVGQSQGLENDVIEDLMDAYLVRQERRRGVTWYELAHDRLVDPIRSDNLRWYEENLSPFHDRAVRWYAEDRPVGMLLSGGDLLEMERWARDHPDRMSDAEKALLRASRRERSQQRDIAERRINLGDLGWGVIFAIEDKERVPELSEALNELLALRREQAGDRYRVFSGPDAYRPGETAERFLERHGIGPGTFNPDQVPYYLLIVGDPETIPWEFQYALAVQNAVGRIHFDRPEEYARYARSVVAAERGQVILQPQAAFFGPQHPRDRASEFLAGQLVAPLADQMREGRPTWSVDSVLAGEADKAQLTQLLGGDRTPALLFTATYGMEFQLDDPDQLPRQGALVCQDWPGQHAPGATRPGPEHYFAAGDVDADARLLGLVAFLFGSSTAGMPRLDDFAPQVSKEREPIAPRAFVARLPQQLLAHPRGGALAVIGHVERAWGTSVTWRQAGTQLGAFEETLRRLMDGHTVGSALEPFSLRYASLSSRLAVELQEIYFYGKSADDLKLGELMTATVDARNYVILGDPAVRLPVDVEAPVTVRPTIEPVIPAAEPTPQPPDIELLKKAARAPLRATELVVFNGIDGASGQYLLPPMSPEQIAKIVMAEPVDEQTLMELQGSYERISGQSPDEVSYEELAWAEESDEFAF
jgi:hypothetical protein